MEASTEVNETIESSEADTPHVKRIENNQPPDQPNTDDVVETHGPVVFQDTEWSEHFGLLQSPGMFHEDVAGQSLICDVQAQSGTEPHFSGTNSLSNRGEMVEELTLHNYRSSSLSAGGSASSEEKPPIGMCLWQNFTRLTGKSRDKTPEDSFTMGYSGDLGKRFLPPSAIQGPLLATMSEPKDTKSSEHISKIDKPIISTAPLTKSSGALRTKVISASGFQQYLVKTTLKGKGIIYQGNFNAPSIVTSHQNTERPNANLDITYKSSHSTKADTVSFDEWLGALNSYKEENTLREWLKPKSQKINKAERMHIFKQILDFVHNCHSQQLALQHLRPSYFIMLPSDEVKYIGSFFPQTQMKFPDSMGQDTHYMDRWLKRKRNTGHGKDSRECSSLKFQKIHDHYCEDSEHYTYPPRSGFGGDGHSEENKVVKFGSRNPSSNFRALKLENKYNSFNMSNATGITSSSSQKPTSELLKLEESWYASPEEINDRMCLFSSNIYSLGVLFFELFCSFKTWELHSADMLNLRHRILPSTFLSENPEEVSFCLWLLHPDPSSRPKSRDILQSKLLGEHKDLLSLDNSSALNEEEDAEADLLLHFLSSLKEQKEKQASKLETELGYLKADITEAERRQLSRAQLLSEGKAFKSDYINSSIIFSEKPVEHSGAISLPSKSNKYEERLIKNADQLENAYFSRFPGIETPEFCAAVRTDCDVLKIHDRYSQSQNDADEATDYLGTFFDGLCKYARYSKFEVCGSLKNVDILSPANVICSLNFDRDEDYFATAGVSKKIKIFDFSALLNDDVNIHYPLVEMPSRSKLSCVCWNNYIKNYLASTDCEGAVQLWDASIGQGFTRFTEHQKRAWSVNFSILDPTKLASGSDDCTVKLWSINERNSIDTIKNMANVCCVQFSDSHLFAFGSADYKIYCYDQRNTKIPWCTLSGHEKAVSYVKFVDSETLVSASTDNTLKLWDLKRTNPIGLSDTACSLTLRGHTNEKNFVGLSVWDGYIACGSESNEVYAYYRTFPMPMTSHKFGSIDPITAQETSDDGGQFVSGVSWRGKSNMVVAANSTGRIKVLQLV
ncbi:hypothetical protein Cni_G04446 [Canna indica]|uniref:Uncharacterized protein n=1 Tax=Canna indica TaxID=4628 RepID=A0AAQ3Q4I0_9LILI|nr:hypothetical protein Cni_G04446 [Canna indica]